MVSQWFQTYLVGRRQYARTGSSASSPTLIVCGVLQGSAIGPILFLLYTAELCSLIQGHGLSPHLYADETQIYGSCRPSALLELQNTAKTEILWSTTGRRSDQLPQSPLRVGTDEVIPTSVVRDLGIYIDSGVSMRSHVTRTVSACFPCCVSYEASTGPFQDPSSSRWWRLLS